MADFYTVDGSGRLSDGLQLDLERFEDLDPPEMKSNSFPVRAICPGVIAAACAVNEWRDGTLGDVMVKEALRKPAK